MARADGRIRDGRILRVIRERVHGRRSGAWFGRELSKATGRVVLREHVSSYEKGHRPIPDVLLEAAAKKLSVPLWYFPEYTSRHITPEQVAMPLVAWALIKSGKMKVEDQRELVMRIEGIVRPDDYLPLVARMLEAQAVKAPQLPSTLVNA